MPQLDFALIADYVRADGPLAHAVAIGIDQVIAPSVPTGQNLGFLARIEFTQAECGRPHRIELIGMDEDGQRLLKVETVVTPEYPPGGDLSAPAGVMVALNLGIPLPRYGRYSIELLADDNSLKSLRLRCVPPVSSSSTQPEQ